jgi:hypothetical protein
VFLNEDITRNQSNAIRDCDLIAVLLLVFRPVCLERNLLLHNLSCVLCAMPKKPRGLKVKITRMIE